MKKLIVLISLICAVYLTTSANEPEDTICFELNEAKNILKFAETGYICDSIIGLKNEEIIKVGSQLELSGQLISKQIVTIKRLKVALLGLGSLAVLLAILGLV